VASQVPLTEMEGLSPELVTVLKAAGYQLLTDVLDLERDDMLKLAGMSPELADQLLKFLSDLEGEEAGGATA
jgi:N utilization substance protein A